MTTNWAKHKFKKLSFFYVFLIGLWIILFWKIDMARSDYQHFPSAQDSRVVEHLRLHVSKENLQAWLEAEKASWAPWLSQKPGFIGRQMFWDEQREEATLLITWATRDQWKNIPQPEINAVQKRFEELARNASGQAIGNPFPLKFEGELLPQ